MLIESFDRNFLGAKLQPFPDRAGGSEQTEFRNGEVAAFHYPQEFVSNRTGRTDDGDMIPFPHSERSLSSAS